MKSLYFLLAGFSIFLFSCSSSYRASQTTDDVYYSPGVNSSNANSYSKSSNDDDGDYVSVQGDDDVNSYGYRNDVQEDWYIRRGISNPFYRNSFSLSLGYGGFYNLYDPLYSPFFPPFSMNSYYSYSGLWSPYYYNRSWLSYTMFPYGYSHFYNPYGGHYSPYFTPYSSYSYGYFNPYPYSVRRDNGPRVMGLSTPRTGISTPIRGQSNPNRPNLAPIRTMRNGNVQSGTIERRVTPRNNNSSTSPVNNNRNVRKFKNNSRNSDYYSPSENRRTSPSRNNDVSPSPTRTFERTSPAPSRSVDRTPSTPPSSNSGSKSAPVRKF